MTPAQHARMIDRISLSLSLDDSGQRQTVAVTCRNGRGAWIWRAVCQHLTCADVPKIGARVVDAGKWNVRMTEVKP